MAAGKLVSPQTEQAIKDVIRSQRNIRGAGLTVTPDGISMGPPGGRRMRPWRDEGGGVLLKVVADAPMGGRYQVFECRGVASGSATSTGSLSLPETGITVGEDVRYADNLPEKGLSIHLLSTNGSVFTMGWPTGAVTTDTNGNSVKLYHIEALPLVLSCSNTGTTASPVYTAFREGTSTAQPAGTGLTPWRLLGPTGAGTNALTFTAATLTQFRLSGTGIAMTQSNESVGESTCT